MTIKINLVKLIVWFWLLASNLNWYFPNPIKSVWKLILIIVCLFIISIYLSCDVKEDY